MNLADQVVRFPQEVIELCDALMGILESGVEQGVDEGRAGGAVVFANGWNHDVKVFGLNMPMAMQAARQQRTGP